MRTIPICLALAISVSGCATDRARITAAEAKKAEAGAVAEAVAIGAIRAPLPELPGDCRRHERAGASDGDRVDRALVKYDSALGRANARVDRCAAWSDEIRAGRAAHQGGR